MQPFSFAKSAVQHGRRFITFHYFPLFFLGFLFIVLSLAYRSVLVSAWAYRSVGVGAGLGLMLTTLWRYRCERRLFWMAFKATFRHLWGRRLLGLYLLILVFATALFWPSAGGMVTGGFSAGFMLSLMVTTREIKRRNRTIIKRN